MQGKSCLTNLLEFVDKVTNATDDGDAMDVIYLDFQKAFDKVPHKRLMLKVDSHGIKDKVWSWIVNWLHDRKQRVILNGAQSEWSEVLSGVPQGSVLGPLLFVIFINDIDNGLINMLLKFADDAKMLGKANSDLDISIIRQDLNKLSEWSSN